MNLEITQLPLSLLNFILKFRRQSQGRQCSPCRTNMACAYRICWTYERLMGTRFPPKKHTVCQSALCCCNKTYLINAVGRKICLGEVTELSIHSHAAPLFLSWGTMRNSSKTRDPMATSLRQALPFLSRTCGPISSNHAPLPLIRASDYDYTMGLTKQWGQKPDKISHLPKVTR